MSLRPETPEELAKIEDEAREEGVFLPEGSKPVNLREETAKSRAARHEIDSQGGPTAVLEKFLAQPSLPLRRTGK